MYCYHSEVATSNILVHIHLYCLCSLSIKIKGSPSSYCFMTYFFHLKYKHFSERETKTSFVVAGGISSQ